MNDPIIRHPQMFKMHKFIFLASKAIDRVLETRLHIGFSQCLILMYVQKHPGVSQRDIAHDRDITPAAVSRHVESLVQHGYLTHSENIKNKKEHILDVSDKGKNLLEKVMTIMNTEIDSLFSDIPATDVETIDRVFSKLLVYFDDTEHGC